MADVIGIIGGSGLYDFEGFEVEERRTLETPFGAPSDVYLIGKVGERRVVFLSRHGQGHRILPHEVNYRANIYGLKVLGVTRILGVSAVGSLKEEIAPGDVVVPDQYIDLTRRRESTFFGDGLAAHVAFGHPVCPELSGLVAGAVRGVGVKVHEGGTYVCMEGPAFSTQAESNMYRGWKASVIGMTNIPEAKLAREAELCYSCIAMVTDYDCWHEEEEHVTVDAVFAVFKKNVANTRRALLDILAGLPAERGCRCGEALGQGALVTAKEHVPPATLARLAPILGKRLG